MALEDILQPGEQLKWRGRAVRGPFVVRALPMVFFGLMWLVIPVTMLWFLRAQPVQAGGIWRTGFQVLLIPFFAVGILALLAPFYRALLWKRVEYAITDRHVILLGGLMGQDVKVLPVQAIKSLSVEVGLADRASGTGSVRLFSGGIESRGGRVVAGYDALEAVKGPHEIAKLILECMRTR